MEDSSPPQANRTERIAGQLAEAVEAVARAKPFAKSLYQGHAYDLTVRLLKAPGGAEALYALAPRFGPAGLFYGGDWDRPRLLQPELASASLRGGAFYVAIEALSEVRMLAIALGDTTDPDMSPEAARAFLEKVVALNADLLFPGNEGEAERNLGLRRGIEQLFAFLAARLGLEGILGSLVDEAERILRQRPILVDRVKEMVARIAAAIPDDGGTEVHERARLLAAAAQGPSECARTHPEPGAYAEYLKSLEEPALAAECAACADAMRRTGLVAPQHAVLLRHVNVHKPGLVAEALALDAVGRDSLAAYQELVRSLIEDGIFPSMCQSVYGLACMLDRGILFFPPVAPGLWRQLRLNVLPAVEEILRDAFDPALSGRSILVAGVLNVLGQPLGVGQGRNPTCQSARAISLWAQHDIPFLLELIAWAARDDEVDMHFEGQHIVSSRLADGLAADLHRELDPVSLVLVPHLDRVYAEMGRRVAGRDEDGHKWINPEFHGWWVSRGFATVVNVLTGFIRDFESFTRIFYAAYHPYYNGNRPVIHPQPAGIAATNVHGVFTGWHAVSIQRVMLDPDNVMRVYFYNPNNDGGQDWGHGVRTSTHGRGEYPGESSLPFEQFAARLYVFHFGWRELGRPESIPSEEVLSVKEQAHASWAANMPWDDTPHDYLAEFAHLEIRT